MRKRIYEIIEMAQTDDKASRIYDIFMLVIIVISLVPLIFHEQKPVFLIIDQITVTIFIIDYILRLITADFKYGKKSMKSFLKYPFSFMAMIDLLSILPSILPIYGGFRSLKALRSLRLFKIFRVFKFLRYSKSLKIISEVFKKSKDALITVCSLAIGYILIAALIIFNIEPESFNTMFDAIYWATVSLTTMGYGDIYPVTKAGRIITIISSFMGIGIVALPAGIIKAGYSSFISSLRSFY